MRFRECVAGAQCADDPGQMRRVLHFQIDFVSMERIVALRKLEIHHIRVVLGEDAGDFGQRSRTVVEYHSHSADGPLRPFSPGKVQPV